jgi:hypothetical protein
MANAKALIEKYKKLLDEALKKNKALSSQLAASIKNFKGAKATLAKLQNQKGELDKFNSTVAALRAQLDSTNRQKTELSNLLVQSKQVIDEQNAQIEKLKPLNSRVLNFKAQYQLRSTGRMIELGSSEENKARQVDDINVSFDIGESLFGSTGDKVVYMSILKDKKPYRTFNNVALKLSFDKSGQVYRAKQRFVIDKKLEDGDYTIKVRYKEQDIMPDYNFKID